MSWLVDISLLVKSCSSIPPTLLMNTRNLLMLRRKAATDHQYLRFWRPRSTISNRLNENAQNIWRFPTSTILDWDYYIYQRIRERFWKTTIILLWSLIQGEWNLGDFEWAQNIWRFPKSWGYQLSSIFGLRFSHGNSHHPAIFMGTLMTMEPLINPFTGMNSIHHSVWIPTMGWMAINNISYITRWIYHLQ